MIIKYYQPTQQPQFKEPTINRDKKMLTVINTEANGDFAHSVSIYADGNWIASGTLENGVFTFDISESALETEHIFELVSRVDATDEIRESDSSSINEYGELEAPTISIEGETLYISATDNAKTFDIYVDGEYKQSIAGDSIVITSLIDSLIGTYSFTAVAQNVDDNRWMSSALSNTARHINVQPLSAARSGLCGGSVGDYILFAGGNGTANNSSILVDAYNTNLFKETVSTLSRTQQDCQSANAGNYVLFGDGKSAYLDPYNGDLTRQTAIALNYGINTLENVMSGSVGGYALFAGSKTLSTVFAVDENLTVTTATDLSAARGRGASANVGDCLLFAGGNYDNKGYFDTVETYDKNLTRSTIEALTIGKVDLAGANVGGYALFAGGTNSDGVLDNVETYNIDLIKGTAENITSPVQWLASASMGKLAVFAGGFAAYGDYSDAVDIYDIDLVKTTKNLSIARYSLAAASNNNCVLIAGGRTTSNYDTVDVFFFD